MPDTLRDGADALGGRLETIAAETRIDAEAPLASMWIDRHDQLRMNRHMDLSI